jgi:hypothetical protein
MGLADLRSLVVCYLFVLLVMSMVRIDLRSMSICFCLSRDTHTRFANFPSSCLWVVRQHCSNCSNVDLLLVYQPDFQVVELGVAELLAQVVEGVLQLVLEVLGIGSAVTWACRRHIEAVDVARDGR